MINNKIHSTTKVSLFIANYSRELRIGTDLKKKGKMKKAMEFAERIRKVQKEVGVALKKTQEEMKRQAERGRKEAEVWKVVSKVMSSTKDLMFKERLASKSIYH